MKRYTLGAISGGLLGVLNGAGTYLTWQREELAIDIFLGAALLGLITGFFTGYLLKHIRKLFGGILIGSLIGLIGSALAGYIAGGVYLDTVPSGAVLGVLVGYIVVRWGKEEPITIKHHAYTSSLHGQPPDSEV